jgi:hypothetical protein
MAGYNPGRFKVSMKKIKSLFVELNLTKDEIKNVKKNLSNVKRTLKSGDIQLAKVISLDPLLIACFSDEFDSVLIYEYPSFLAKKYYLKEEQYLVCSNSYWPRECFSVEKDIIIGGGASSHFRDVICFIPLFICKEDQELFCKTVFDKLFSDEEIEHFNESINVYLKVMPGSRRNGFKTLIYYYEKTINYKKIREQLKKQNLIDDNNLICH